MSYWLDKTQVQMERVTGYQGSEIFSSVAVILLELIPNLAFKDVPKRQLFWKKLQIFKKTAAMEIFYSKSGRPCRYYFPVIFKMFFKVVFLCNTFAWLLMN